jgi:hypothetical protein
MTMIMEQTRMHAGTMSSSLGMSLVDSGYKLSLRHLAEMLLTRGFTSSYEAVRCAKPQLESWRQWQKLAELTGAKTHSTAGESHV